MSISIKLLLVRFVYSKLYWINVLLFSGLDIKRFIFFVFIWYHLCWSSFETSFLSSVHSQLYALLPTTINSIFKLCSAFIAIYLTTTTTTSLDYTLNCCLCSKANDTLLLLDTIQPFWLIHEPKFVNKQKRSELQTFYQIALQW